MKTSLTAGGLGLRLLTTLNKALHGKWIWRFRNESKSLWKKIIVRKWFGNNPHDLTLLEKSKYGLSLWKSIMHNYKAVLKCSTWIVGKGNKVRLWHDVWHENGIFKSHFSFIYAIARDKDMSIERRLTMIALLLGKWWLTKSS